MRNQPKTAETPIAMTIPIDPDMAHCGFLPSSVYKIQSLKEGVVTKFSHVCAGIKACEGVLSHEDAYHNDVSFARADTPAGISGVIQKLGEYKATRLKFGSGGENGNDHCEGPNRVPPDGNIVKVFEEVNSESVDQAYVYVQFVYPIIKGLGPPRRTLANQDGSIHPNRRLFVWDETGVYGSSGGDECRASETMGICQHHMTSWILLERKNLIPVVTAT
jgi:hypothetical protein